MKIKSDVDLVGEIWSDRPAIEFKPIWRLMDSYAGVSYPEKVANIRKRMEEEKADTLLLTSLDEIAWVTNIRGDDIEYNPVCFSYMVITKYDSLLFANTKSFDEKTTEFIKSLILPLKRDKTISIDNAFGIFLGYTLGIDATKYSNSEFRNAVNEKLKKDLDNVASDIERKINTSGLTGYSFYFYILPFNNAKVDRASIIKKLKGE